MAASWTRPTFCPDTIVPARSDFDRSPDAHAMLTPDGVLTLAGAGWRFDLSTPHCN